MPSNKSLALHRLAKLKTRLENNEQYHKDYVAFMNDLVSKKYAERVPEEELSKDDGHTWYIPQTRETFNCADMNFQFAQTSKRLYM